jgi:2-polyprenyl-3-methyl-5-hydroxy-6-metoxy-1,4-benzoquinol methylase
MISYVSILGFLTGDSDPIYNAPMLGAHNQVDTSNRSNRTTHNASHFDYIATYYVHKDLAAYSRPARRMPLLQTIRDLPFETSPHILEVGCGGGFAAHYLENYYASYTGLDHSEGLIHEAACRNHSDRITFHAMNFNLFDTSCLFDLILMIGVLHHMPDPLCTLKKAFALLKPGGWIAFNEPHSSNRYFSRLRKLRVRMDASYSSEQDEVSAKLVTLWLSQMDCISSTIIGHGFFSTPFAKVVLRPQAVFAPPVSSGLFS